MQTTIFKSGTISLLPVIRNYFETVFCMVNWRFKFVRKGCRNDKNNALYIRDKIGWAIA